MSVPLAKHEYQFYLHMREKAYLCYSGFAENESDDTQIDLLQSTKISALW